MKTFKTLFRAGLLTGFLLVVLMSTQGCVSLTQQQFREAETGILEHESIAILRRKYNRRNETEESFIDCLFEQTSSKEGAIKVISDREFVDALFPWMENRTAPRKVEDMSSLYENELVRDKLEALDTRYIVWVDGTTQRTDQSGSVQCAVATGGVPACFGFLTWEADSSYEATVWDVSRGIVAGRISAESKGVSFVPAIIVPIPFIARTQASACISLATQLKGFIAGNDATDDNAEN